MVESLDWFPLYIHRLMGSSAWKLKDYQFGWYMRLLIEAADREGYLPGSPDELWQIAGAKSGAYFLKYGGPELVSRYFKRTDDGSGRIYNSRLLAVLNEQSKKLRKGKGGSSSLSIPVVDVGFEVEGFDFESAFLALWKIYPRKQDSPLTRNLFIQAVEKVVKLHGMRRSEAAAYILSRTEIYVQKSKFIQNLATYLDAGTYEQDESMWEQGNGKRSVLDEI